MSPIAGCAAPRAAARPSCRRRAGVEVRVGLRVHRLAAVEARQRRAVRVEDVSSPLESASTVSSRLSPFRSNSRWDSSPPVPRSLRSRWCRRVAVGEQHLAVLAAVALRVGDDDADGEGRLVRVLVARALGGGGRVVVAPPPAARRARRGPRSRSMNPERAVGGAVWLTVARRRGTRSRPARCPAPTGAGSE